MKCIVTGGRGFLGSAIAKHLEGQGHIVIATDKDDYDLDRRDVEELAKMFQSVDEFYHCAGIVGTSELERCPHVAVEQNILNTLKMFQAAKDVPRVFFPSKPISSHNIYTLTKKFIEDTMYLFPNVKILRCFNIFGPGQAMVPVKRMLPAFSLRAMKGLPLQIYGDGSQVVDMLYAKDAAEGIVRFIRSDIKEILDFGGHPMTVREVAEDINTFFKNGADIESLPMRPGEDPSKAPKASSRFFTLFPMALTKWKTALWETLEWYQSRSEDEITQALELYKIQT